MFFDNFRFCYRATFDSAYQNGPIDKCLQFKYKNYCFLNINYINRIRNRGGIAIFAQHRR